MTVVLLLVALNEDQERCEQECFGTYRTYEAGHPWTNYVDSWQWDAQNAIVGVAFILAVIAAFSLIGEHLRRAVVLTGVSWGFSAAWIVWVALSPATGTRSAPQVVLPRPGSPRSDLVEHCAPSSSSRTTVR